MEWGSLGGAEPIPVRFWGLAPEKNVEIYVNADANFSLFGALCGLWSPTGCRRRSGIEGSLLMPVAGQSDRVDAEGRSESDRVSP